MGLSEARRFLPYSVATDILGSECTPSALPPCTYPGVMRAIRQRRAARREPGQGRTLGEGRRGDPRPGAAEKAAPASAAGSWESLATTRAPSTPLCSCHSGPARGVSGRYIEFIGRRRYIGSIGRRRAPRHTWAPQNDSSACVRSAGHCIGGKRQPGTQSLRTSCS